MNPILESLRERKSVRVFLDKPVSPEEKAILLDAAVQAPTAGNQQLYTILDITDQSLKARLAVTCDNQPFIATAPLVLIFCADCARWLRAYEEGGQNPRRPGVGDLLLAVTDASIAAQNVVVAAQALGLGSCYIGDVLEQKEEHCKLLQLPDWVVPVAMLVIGWPTQQQQNRPKPKRFDLPYVVHENGYRTLSGDELRTMFDQRRGAQTYEAFIEAFCKRKYDSDFSKEMTRSVQAYIQTFEGGT